MSWRPSIVDGDGHIFEDGEAIVKFLPDPYRDYKPVLGVFPPLDHIHNGNFSNRINTDERRAGPTAIGPVQWEKFLDDLGLEATVLYPTAGLAYGKVIDPEWAIALARAYNDWLAETYVRRNPRFRGMALVPLQEPEAAVGELRRAVTELGMCGAMLPSNGLKTHLGAKDYWPLYEEANRLGCALAIHGGCHDNFGFDDLNVFAAAHALGHPAGIMISFAAMLFNGIFDRFPRMRVAFLEAGVAAYLTLLERCDESYRSFPQKNGPAFELRAGESVADYIIRQCHEGRIAFGCEGDELSLPFAVKVFGPKPFLYSSDFPHEVTLESCRHEIEELLESEELSREAKQAILGDNSRQFYRLGA